MYDVLQKIGIPATIAAVVSTAVVIIPFIFKLDERYAKEEDLQHQVERLEALNRDLQKELAELSGFQSAMIAWLQARPTPEPHVSSPSPAIEHIEIPPSKVFAPRPRMSPRPAEAASVPKPSSPSLADISKAVQAQQERLQK